MKKLVISLSLLNTLVACVGPQTPSNTIPSPPQCRRDTDGDRYHDVMFVTPRELRDADIPTAKGGFHKDAVDDMLERAADTIEELQRRIAELEAAPAPVMAQASEMGEWKRTGGVAVASVAPGGPAAKAGLRTGDVLVKANGRVLRNSLDWESVKLDLHVGDPITISVQSAGQTSDKRLVSSDLHTATASPCRI